VSQWNEIYWRLSKLFGYHSDHSEKSRQINRRFPKLFFGDSNDCCQQLNSAAIWVPSRRDDDLCVIDRRLVFQLLVDCLLFHNIVACGFRKRDRDGCCAEESGDDRILIREYLNDAETIIQQGALTRNSSVSFTGLETLLFEISQHHHHNNTLEILLKYSGKFSVRDH
jgi:hypothetical protein